ncbi:hypothetical protein BCV72DRAFT_197768 [Rhizopus microsporus var. microsporus]|uniref:Uncharacterized protein n=1 Tax=Rhizopus microsporus var. microsporus TaxID=86635 RepID=A0A1X0RHA7_RHIZD|nr:hypothetical protein BCV72DRAFT_197768 [Rhizopus microsporus var. microsporus]
MQKEIEDLQMQWKEEETKKMSELEQEYQERLNSIKAEHEKAMSTAVSEPLALKEKELTGKEQEINELKSKLNEKEKIEEELRTLKIAYDKMIQAKDQEIKEAEERLGETMVTSQSDDSSKIQSIVSQHQKEIKVLQTQFQQLLDLKDKEIEGFAYRLKTITATQQKDIEKLNEEYKQKMSALESECQKKDESLKSKALEMRWMAAEFESSEAKLKDQSTKLQNLENDNNQLRIALHQQQEENKQMLR